uniref:Putative secreted protein n=1 Tax=Anopheles darlingi TaxID=43151 RepID=A0A2M4DH25_ANODA
MLLVLILGSPQLQLTFALFLGYAGHHVTVGFLIDHLFPVVPRPQTIPFIRIAIGTHARLPIQHGPIGITQRFEPIVNRHLIFTVFVYIATNENLHRSSRLGNELLCLRQRQLIRR